MSDERLRDPRLRENLARRAQLTRAIRAFFDAEGFLEVETGQIVDEPGQEPHLAPFEVNAPHGGPKRTLITSPELRMKRLLAAGFPKIFELSHCFRSGLGERSDLHHPEFTMLEWYRAGADDLALISDLERLLPWVAERVDAGAVRAKDGGAFDLAHGIERVSVKDAFARHAGVDLEPFLDGDFAAFRSSARAAGMMAVKDDEDAESLFFRILLDRVEPRLGRRRPTALTHYPASMASLAVLDGGDPRTARRFELYLDSVEIANAFVELTDPVEQRRRFEADRAKKRAAGFDPGPMPERFLSALSRGLPPCAGIALGVDRLLMFLVGARRIDDVLAFPDESP